MSIHARLGQLYSYGVSTYSSESRVKSVKLSLASVKIRYMCELAYDRTSGDSVMCFIVTGLEVIQQARVTCLQKLFPETVTGFG